MWVQVSAVLITYNEESDIARAIDSVSWCDEILVVDSGSTDRTVDICKAGGCKVLHHDFTGYGEQKGFAVSQAAHDWVLVVDADEQVTPELRDEIRRLLEAPGDCRGFRIPITTIFWDRVVRTEDRHTAAKLRLFDRRYGQYRPQLVHESVALDGHVELLRERMYNYSYSSITDYFDKFNRYTSAAARQSFAEGKLHSVAGAVLLLPITFCQFYFGKGYIRDGGIGAVWSLFSAFYPTVKYLKLWELNRAAARQAATGNPAKTADAPAAPPANRPPAEPAPPPSIAASRAVSRSERLPIYILAAAACAVCLAVVWMPIFGQYPSGDYAACLLFAVLVTARLWGYRMALLATGLSILALDYFTVSAPNSFEMPQAQDAYRLGLFLVLSLLTISVVHRVPRPAR